MAWIWDDQSQDYQYQDAQDDDSGLAGSSFMDNIFQEQQDRNRNSQVATLDRTVGYQPQDIMDAAKRVVGGLKGYGQTLANMAELQTQPSAEQQRQWRIRSQIEADQQARQSAESADTTNPFVPARSIANHLFNPLQAMQDIGNAPDVPYWSDFAREQIRPAIAEGGRQIGEGIGSALFPGSITQGGGYRPSGAAQSAGDVGQMVGGMAGGIVPANSAELALTAAPFVGEIRGVPGAVGRGLRGYGERALESGLGQQSALPNEISSITRFRNPLEVNDITELPQDVGQRAQGRHILEGPANSQLEWREYPNGDAHIVNVNAGDVQGKGVGTRLLLRAIDDIKAANADATITADLNSEGGARLFARQPGAEFTDMRGNPISAQEAASQADQALGPHVTLPASQSQRQLSMVGGGASIPENLDFATARAALKGLGYDADNMTRANIEHLIQDINAGKVTSLPEAGPREVPSQPVSDEQLLQQTQQNLGLEGGAGQPPNPPAGNDYTAGGGMFGNEPPSGPQGGHVGHPYQPGQGFPVNDPSQGGFGGGFPPSPPGEIPPGGYQPGRGFPTNDRGQGGFGNGGYGSDFPSGPPGELPPKGYHPGSDFPQANQADLQGERPTPQSLKDLGDLAQTERDSSPIPSAPELSKGPGFISRQIQNLKGVLGLPQTVMTGGDLSATLRQGSVMGPAAPSIYARAVKDEVAAYVSDSAAQAAKQIVEDSPLYSFAKDSGVHQYEYGPGIAANERVPGYTGLNESGFSKALGGAPIIKNGERAYATMLNTQGFGVFEDYAQSMIDLGVRNEKQFTDLAAVVNHGRGYGTGKVADLASAANIFFSGRNMVSRAQLLLDPFNKSGSLLEPSARQLAAKNLVGFAAANVGLMSFLGLTGAAAGGAWSVNPNPLAGDFGMLRVGNTRIDTMAGMAPLLRVLAREPMAIAHGDWAAVTPELTRFFANKSSPLVSVLRDAVVSADPSLKRYLGHSDGLSAKDFATRFAPLMLQDMLGAYQGAGGGAVGIAAGAGVGVGSFLGLGANTYQDKGATNPTSSGPKPWEGNVSSPVQSGPKKPWE